MKKTIISLLSFFFIFFIISFFAFNVSAQVPNTATPITPEQCGSGCAPDQVGECATSYEDWLENRDKNFWVKDPEVVALGQNAERSKQFLNWVLTHKSIDNHPSILAVWSYSRNITYFLLILAAVLIGVGIIVGQKNNFDLKINISSQILKLALWILYITFSATFVIFIIQISDVIGDFSIKSLGADKLFNVFFFQEQPVSTSNSSSTCTDFLCKSERGYAEFYQNGCSNISLRAAESLRISKFLIFFSNITYFIIGILLLLRKIILWFFIIISPFLAIIMSFKIIRNVGWVWIGTFLKWVFYGPIFSIFIGAIAKIWNSGTSVPYVFDFQRIGTEEGFIYPTAINIMYGGPNQAGANKLGYLNSSSYVDTFAEYLISLIMLWVAIVLPWLLLKFFRDYCCDGIYAIKNILMAGYDGLKNSPKTPISPLQNLKASIAMDLPKSQGVDLKFKIDNLEDIKRANVESIKEAMNLSMSKMSDIARFEIDKNLNSAVSKNLNYLKNPMSAQNATERQQFMNLRSELFSRALKGDSQARSTLASISASPVEQNTQKNEILSTMPTLNPVVVVTSIKVGLPKDKIISTFNSVYNTLVSDKTIIDTLSASANVPTLQTEAILKNTADIRNQNVAANKVVDVVSEQTNIEKNKVKEILEKLAILLNERQDILKGISQKEDLSEDAIRKIISTYLPVALNPEKHIEESISLPKSVSIEEYEEVKSMWVNHYENGDIPISDTIKNRNQWIEADIISITNILNKLYSNDTKLKDEALNQISYILPVFMMNKMNGEQIAIYLKAKIEAGKQILNGMIKEEELKQSIENNKEFVNIPVSKAEENNKEMYFETKENV